MKKLTKTLVGLASAMLALGVVLAIGGWVMGGQTQITTEIAGYPLTVGVQGFRGVSGSSANVASRTDGDRALAPFDGLDIDISLGDVFFVPGEDYGVELSWHGKNYELHYTNEKGILKVWSTTVTNIGVNLDYKYGGTVTVYFPADAEFKDVDVSTDLGDADLSGFSADAMEVSASLGDVTLADAVLGRGNLTLDLGDLNMDAVSADELDLDLSLGDLTAIGLTTRRSLTVETDMGQIVLDGTFYGDTDLNDSMGDVRVTTSLPEGDYSYDLDVSMGDIYINGMEQKHAVSRGSGSNTLTVENDMGDIELYFG